MNNVLRISVSHQHKPYTTSGSLFSMRNVQTRGAWMQRWQAILVDVRSTSGFIVDLTCCLMTFHLDGNFQAVRLLTYVCRMTDEFNCL